MADARFIEIWEFATGAVVRRINVTGKSEIYVERYLRGLLINMNTDKFGVRDTAWADDECGATHKEER